MPQNHPDGDSSGTPNGTPPRPPRSSRFAAARTLASVGTVGLTFVFSIAIGTALGVWLDRLTGWSPLFFLVFFLAGVAAGIVNVYRTFSRLPK